MATHASILAWETSWTEESGGATRHGVAKSWMHMSARSCTHTPPLKQTTEIKQKFIANNVTKEIRNHKEHSINPK